MNILFIFTNINTRNNKQYPHGIGALSAVLKRAGHQTNLIYLTKEIKREKLLKIMSDYAFDLVGISATTNQWEIIKRFPAWIKESYPKIPIILGGIHSTLASEEAIATDGVDIICRGEGEMPLLKLVETLENGQDYSYTPSLWVKKQVDNEEEIIRNPIMPLVQDLDTLPFSDRQIIDYQNLLYNHSCIENPQEASLMAGRGCPFPCTYCCNKSLKDLYPQNQTYARKRTVDNVIRELKILKQNYSIRSFYIEDDTFTLNREWVKEFCKKYRQEINLPFKIYIQPLTVDYEILFLLKKAGLYEVQIGVECGNEKYRREMLNRNISNQRLIEVFGWLDQLRIQSFAFIIIGLPYETKELIMESMDLIRKLKPFHTQISVYYPYPGNELYDYCVKNSLLTSRTKTTFFGGISTIKLSYINQKELKKMYNEFYQLSFYLSKKWLKLETETNSQKTKKPPLKIQIIFFEFKLLIYKIYFVLIKLPLFLAREPYWLFKLNRSHKKYGLYRALQTVFDYHSMINFNSGNSRIKKKIIPLKPVLLNKIIGTKHCNYQPKISIIVPIYSPNRNFLHKTIKSVLNQSYNNWELCLVDGSQKREKLLKDMLNYYAQKDDRIKLKYLPQNYGIAGNSNEAMQMASGEFIGLLDHDDKLTPDALQEVVMALNGPAQGAEFIYTDEDKINLDGSHSEPFHKPDWSPDYLLSTNYICHFAVIKSDLIRRVNGFDADVDGAQDYDLFLKITEQTDKIYHIPKILYHWRKSYKSTASLVDSKPYITQAGVKALISALKRRNIKGEVIPISNTGYGRVKYDIKGNPLISIIIPFRDQIYLIKKCISNILKKTIYRNFEIILIDNQSKESLAEYALSQQQKYGLPIKIHSYNSDFNFSAMNNIAASQAQGKYLLFLNNDTEVITGEWLSAMLEHAQRKATGAVGAKLLYPNGAIQHCGVHLRPDGMSEHYCMGLKEDAISSPGHRTNSIGNVSAVTGACMMIEKKIFEEMGGFEAALPNNYNDIDLCLKLRAHGYLIVYTPYAKLYHYESASRLAILEKWEKDYMKKKWSKEFSCDPYYYKF